MFDDNLKPSKQNDFIYDHTRETVPFVTFLTEDYEVVGQLLWVSGQFVFKGNVNKSANIFFDCLNKYIEENK